MGDLKGWQSGTLAGRIHVKHGYPFKSEHFADTGKYIVLTPGNFWESGGFKLQAGKEKFYNAEFPREYLHKRGDLIVAMTEQSAGLLGSMALVPQDNCFLHNQRIGKVTATSDDVHLGFLNYAFRLLSVRTQLSNTASGSKVRHTSPERIYDVSLPLPPIADQKAIAAVLSALDAKIDLNNRINAELEALAKTIYDYWFVQFDFPDAHGRPYKSSGGAMVWNDTLKREIPSGWSVTNLAAWVAKQKTGEWGGNEFSDSNEVQITCIRGADINALNGSAELKAPTRYISSSKSGKFLAPCDIVIEISGGSPTQSTGRAALISPEVIERFENPLVCSNFCKALTLKEPERAHEFLQLWNALYSGGVFFGWEGKTSGIKNLQFDAFVDNHSVPVAPPEVSRKYQSLSCSLEKRKQNGLRENRELTQLRDWLLPLLMNGQVRVA